MTCRRTISICVAVMAFLLEQSLPAYQAEDAAKDATKTIKKKAKKAGQQTVDATRTAASATAETAEKTTRKAGKAAGTQPSETANSSTRATTKATSSATGAASRDASSASASATKATPAPARIISDSEIASAKASGQVWVNTETGVYHKSGRWYGATKQGKFMTEQEATKAGYHASKGRP